MKERNPKYLFEACCTCVSLPLFSPSTISFIRGWLKDRDDLTTSCFLGKASWDELQPATSPEHYPKGVLKIQLPNSHEEASLKLLCMEGGGKVTGAFPPFSTQRSIDAKNHLWQGFCEAKQVWKEMVAVAVSKWELVFSCSCDGLHIWKVRSFWRKPQVEAYGRVHTKFPSTYYF